MGEGLDDVIESCFSVKTGQQSFCFYLNRRNLNRFFRQKNLEKKGPHLKSLQKQDKGGY